MRERLSVIAEENRTLTRAAQFRDRYVKDVEAEMDRLRATGDDTKRQLRHLLVHVETERRGSTDSLVLTAGGPSPTSEAEQDETSLFTTVYELHAANLRQADSIHRMRAEHAQSVATAVDQATDKYAQETTEITRLLEEMTEKHDKLTADFEEARQECANWRAIGGVEEGVRTRRPSSCSGRRCRPPS